MKKSLPLAAALAAALAAPAALGQSRPDTLAMSCAAAAGIVQARGAAVLGTGPNIYDRYVRDGSACLVRQDTQPAWVQSLDVAQCFVGYTCVNFLNRRGER